MAEFLAAFFNSPKFNAFWGIVRSILFSRRGFERPRVVKTGQEEGVAAQEADCRKRFEIWDFVRAFLPERGALRPRTFAHTYGTTARQSVCSMISSRGSGGRLLRRRTNPAG